MCTNVAYTKREMEIIHAIYSIEPDAKISIKGKQGIQRETRSENCRLATFGSRNFFWILIFS